MLLNPRRDSDGGAVVFFRHHSIPNPLKTIEMGRPIFDDIEVCEIRSPGSRDVKVFPATAFSTWVDDYETGAQVPVTYAERFSRQYRQFKESQYQTKAGTPLAQAPFLTEARRAELRALNVYTVEALAEIDGQELKNLGPGGRDLKNKAMEYLEASVIGARDAMVASEMEAVKLRNEVLEQDIQALRERLAAKEAEAKGQAHPLDQQQPISVNVDQSFDDMTSEQLREFIAVRNNGVAPVGSLPRKTLVRMAVEVAK